MEFNATFLATIVSFIVFVFLMNKVLYAPILNIMEERKAFIDNNYKAVEKNDAKVDKLNQKREEKLADAKNDAKESYNETIEEFKAQKNEIIVKAQNATSEELENSRKELERLSADVKEGLEESMTDLANDIVEKVIGYRSEVQGFDNRTVDEILYH